MPLTPDHIPSPGAPMAAMTPEARRHALAFNAVGAALRPHDEWLRLTIREDIARAVLAALDADEPQGPIEPTQDSTGWAWRCHHQRCPHGQEGFWTRRGAARARDRHLATHGADHA